MFGMYHHTDLVIEPYKIENVEKVIDEAMKRVSVSELHFKNVFFFTNRYVYQ